MEIRKSYRTGGIRPGETGDEGADGCSEAH